MARLLKTSFVSLALLLSVNAAFTPSFSAATAQCAEYKISWTSTDTARAGPPFNLVLVPVNDATAATADTAGRGGGSLSLPVQQAIPDSAWDAATNTGQYTITALPFRTGERFIMVMDDGFGLGTGRVSAIQTVGPNPAGTSCLGQTAAESNIVFSLSSLQPPQCGPLSIVTGQAKSIRGFVPNGSAFNLDLPAASTGNMTTEWSVNVPSGSSFVLMYTGTDGKLASSGLVQTAPGTSSDCIANGPHVTGSSTATGTTSLTGSPVFTEVSPSATARTATPTLSQSVSSSPSSTSRTGGCGRSVGISSSVIGTGILGLFFFLA